jgi:hypothetical protein
MFGTARNNHPTYSTLVEAMNNTREHAAYAERRGFRRGKSLAQPGQAIRWWAGAYYDEETGRGSFTLLDHGVGILNSVHVQPFRKLYIQRGLDESRLLEAVLGGLIRSRTGKRTRGKGLPHMRMLAELGRLANLTIVAGRAFGSVGEGRYVTLRSSFPGTLIHWELVP